MFTCFGEREQANVSQMDWQGAKRASDPNTGSEWFNQLEVA
jgi:hypothetical protein